MRSWKSWLVVGAGVAAVAAVGVGVSVAAPEVLPEGVPFAGPATSRAEAIRAFGDDPETAPPPTPSGTPTRLTAPAPEGWEAEHAARTLPEVEAGGLRAQAFHFDAQVYERPAADPEVLGLVRRGTVLRVARRMHGPGCDGRWYELEPFGVACTSLGFNVSTDPPREDFHFAPPAVEQTHPYRYAKVATPAAPRYYRVPTAAEIRQVHAAMEAEQALPDVVADRMEGVYFVALAPDQEEGQAFYQTVRGRWVAADDIEVRDPIPMRGSRLGDGLELPVAFVFDQDQPLFERRDGRVVEIGIAEKHARFHVEEVFTAGGVEYVLGPRGEVVRRDAVRLVERVDRPDEVGPDDKWVHIELAEQALTAYEGETPVFATLVSSGKEGYDTPRGVFQIHDKYLSITMNGDDPIDGFYEVEEVPWTMYYWSSYALHGAYWHNDFGKVRSHGCTNLSPTDARWVFHWSSPPVPDGWHGIRRRPSTWLYFTRGPAEDDAS